MPKPFVHLHLHTQYSLLDGAIKHIPLFERAKALGMPAVAQTDHGNLFGSIEFYEKVPRFSDDWYDAMFESGWAYFQDGSFGRSLGMVIP